jgi:hypothetical protein
MTLFNFIVLEFGRDDWWPEGHLGLNAINESVPIVSVGNEEDTDLLKEDEFGVRNDKN